MEKKIMPVDEKASFLHDLRESVGVIQSADWELVKGTVNAELEHVMNLLRYKYKPTEVQIRALSYSMYSPNRIEDGGEVFTINGEIDPASSASSRETHFVIFKIGRDDIGEFKENMYFSCTFNPEASEVRVVKTHRNFPSRREGEWTWKLK